MSSRARSVRSVVIPAPTLGKNSRDSIDDMEIGYAIESRNFIPRNDRYSLRRGYASFCTGLGGGVYSLFAHKDTDGTERLLAGANGNIWNVSTGTASSLVSGRSNNRWQTTQLDGATVMCNGADTPYYYTIAYWISATTSCGSVPVCFSIGTSVMFSGVRCRGIDMSSWARISKVGIVAP